MKILYIFNHYQNPGGEEQAFAAEAALMESNGHTVVRYAMHNDDINGMSRFVLTSKLIWNQISRNELYRIVRDNRIDVAHFHNTFPLISPSAYYAAKAGGARVVHTLHNFRLICPGALLSREGRVCEECLGSAIPWRGVLNSCYRNSTIASAAVVTMLTGHRLIGTWDRQIDSYIALSEFAKNKFVQGGLPGHKLFVKPNFVEPDPTPGSGGGGYALFVGRLSRDKGVDVLVRAWQSLGATIPLKVAGDGPMASDVRSAATSTCGIEYLGRQRRDQIFQLMKDAAFLIFPSVWYEGFPMTIAEAYASGLPVIASDLGTMASVVKHAETGLRFLPGNVPDSISTVQWLVDHPDEATRFRVNARREFTVRYSAAVNYAQLIAIYQNALRGGKGSEAQQAA